MIYRTAHSNDIPTLVHLINSAYRGESSRAGWTTEADLLEGRRIDEAGLLHLLNDPDSLLLIAQSGDTVLASIHAHRQESSVHFGLFAVQPTLQAGGIGKGLLGYAESQAFKQWGVKTAVMEVITRRSELIAYYERRGYRQSGERIAFPESELWSLSAGSLELAVLEKEIGAI